VPRDADRNYVIVWGPDADRQSRPGPSFCRQQLGVLRAMGIRDKHLTTDTSD